MSDKDDEKKITNNVIQFSDYFGTYHMDENIQAPDDEYPRSLGYVEDICSDDEFEDLQLLVNPSHNLLGGFIGWNVDTQKFERIDGKNRVFYLTGE